MVVEVFFLPSETVKRRKKKFWNRKNTSLAGKWNKKCSSQIGSKLRSQSQETQIENSTAVSFFLSREKG